jgi:DNA polymerase
LIVYCDIETYSATSLDAGVYRYVEDPSFQILILAYSIDGGPVQAVYSHEAMIDLVNDWRGAGALLVAHNVGFERVCLSRVLGMPTGEYLPVTEWYDTMAVAGERGLPQSLWFLAQTLKTTEKLPGATKLINIFAKPNRKGEQTLPEERLDEWMEFDAYCRQDVEALIGVYHELERLGGWPRYERLVYEADQVINDRGIHIDVEMAELAKQADLENEAEQRARISEIAGIDNVGSVPQLRKWLESEGIPVPNAQAATLDGVLERDDLTDVQREVLETRKDLALAASKKYTAALLSVCEDDRIRGSLRFFGAHTGRWSGRGTQIQNLPRAQFDSEQEVAAAIVDLKMGERLPSQVLKKLVRPMFDGPLTVVDYASIEARVLAWLANETWALQAFNDGRDIYVETAQRMGGLTRSQGKVAVLALGYNGGANSIRALGSEKDWAHLTDDELRTQFVLPWRKANPRIARLWEASGNAFDSGGPVAHRLKITHTEDGAKRHAHFHLPSGRTITYRNIRFEKYFSKEYNKQREGWRYDMPTGGPGSTYGGRLVENATQAVARDLLAAALVRLEDAGYTVVGHVHDEVLVEGEHNVDDIIKIMCDSPSWAAGLPVDAEGFVCARYRKA